MNEQTKIDLQWYYGELMQQYENSYDYFIKNKIQKKLRAIECLLELN
mgnify:CR=1 FL=1